MSAQVDACGKVCNAGGLSKGNIRVREYTERTRTVCMIHQRRCNKTKETVRVMDTSRYLVRVGL